MKRVPLYRAPLAGLMSLAILATALPPTALADVPPRANNPDDEDRHDGRVLREAIVESREVAAAAAEAPAAVPVPAAECEATTPAARRACERAQRL
jgi:hypothetical protein